MITEFICKNCDCATTSQTGTKIVVQIDEKLKLIYETAEIDYIIAMDAYNKRVAETTEYFNERIKEHNDSLRWYNINYEWVLCKTNCCIEIRELNHNSGYVKQDIIIKPYLEQNPYEYIECPVCGERKYIGTRKKKLCRDYA